jgi:peptide subunit release factor 1 (eRF1)
MITRDMIRELADFQSPLGDAITFYYQPGTPQDKSHRQEAIEIKDIVKNAMRRVERAGKNGSVKGDLQRILEMSEQLHGNSGRAKAVFACGSQKFWREVDLPACIGTTRLKVNSKFNVSPLANLNDALEKVCVCLVDSERARFLELHMDEMTEQESFVDELPPHGRSNGFAGYDAGHAERKVENEASKHFKKVGDRLISKYGNASWARILIGCRQDAWSSIERQLHPYVKQRLVGHFVIDPASATPNEVRAEVEHLLEEQRSKEREDLLKEVIDEARANNHGAIGLKRTLRALERGEVQILLIGEGLSTDGVECTNCGHLDIRMVEKCAVCGQETREIENFIDTVMGRALRAGVEVIHIPANPEFQKAGNIGALLRFRAERSIGERLLA